MCGIGPDANYLDDFQTRFLEPAKVVRIRGGNGGTVGQRSRCDHAVHQGSTAAAGPVEQRGGRGCILRGELAALPNDLGRQYQFRVAQRAAQEFGPGYRTHPQALALPNPAAQPAVFRRLRLQRGDLLAWLRVYGASTPGVSVLDNATVRLDLDNEPQPDVLMRIESAAIGQSRLDADDYVTGAPELVVDMVASSAAYDLHEKLHVYRRNGVLEYLVWRVYDGEFDWFVLDDDTYQPLARDSGGIFRSRAFPGLRLAADALLGGDFVGLLAELSKGLDTPEHAAFIAKLRTGPLA